MTPKQKRHLTRAAETLAHVAAYDAPDPIVAGRLARLGSALVTLSFERPPKCGTCRYYDQKCSTCGNRRSMAWQLHPLPTGFGCVLHSEYESEET